MHVRTAPPFLLPLLGLTALFGCGGDDDASSDPDARPSSTADAAVIIDDPDAAIAVDVRVGNVPEGCEFDNNIGPILPEEAGHLAGTALTPPSYPFTFTQVSYALGFANECVTGLAHEVVVFAAADMPPSNTPSAADETQVIPVPAGADAEADRTITLVLPEPITITEGALVVAVKLNADGDNSLCLRSCGTGGESGDDWWSNAAAEPFAWADMLDDFGFTSQFVIDATGRAE
jgi:hypothetical protein